MDLQPRRAESLSREAETPWFHRLSRPTLFLIVTLALVGGYLAFSIPCPFSRALIFRVS